MGVFFKFSKLQARTTKEKGLSKLVSMTEKENKMMSHLANGIFWGVKEIFQIIPTPEVFKNSYWVLYIYIIHTQIL